MHSMFKIVCDKENIIHLIGLEHFVITPHDFINRKYICKYSEHNSINTISQSQIYRLYSRQWDNTNKNDYYPIYISCSTHEFTTSEFVAIYSKLICSVNNK